MNGCDAAAPCIVLVQIGGCDLHTKVDRAVQSGAVGMVVVHSEDPFAIHLKQHHGTRLFVAVVGHSDGAVLRAALPPQNNFGEEAPTVPKVALGADCQLHQAELRKQFEQAPALWREVVQDQHYVAAMRRGIQLNDARRDMPRPDRVGPGARDAYVEVDTLNGPHFGRVIHKDTDPDEYFETFDRLFDPYMYEYMSRCMVTISRKTTSGRKTRERKMREV